MQIKDKTIVVTGAASGIGRALVHAFHEQGAKALACVDINAKDVEQVAAKYEGVAYPVDVSSSQQITTLIDQVERDQGPIDLFCSNAGIGIPGGVEVSDEEWQRIWDINLMAHVVAARHLIPKMIERGGGYLLNTASAAGLLSQVGSAPYAVTKHAAVALAEWMAITYGDQGIKVSVLCPQAVRTAMTAGNLDGVASIDGMLEPDAVAKACIETIAEESFLVLPHPQVLEYMRNKTANYDKWIGGMRKLNRHYQH